MLELLPGTEVSARGLRWELVFTQPAGDQTLYRLRCLESALRGTELDLLVPFERVEPIGKAPDPTRPARLQDWRVYHDAFLLEQELGPHALLAAQPGRLRIAAYQLVPVMRVLSMARPRLLIADDVGLGKTVEAGLVLAELIARRRAHRILIVSPAGPLILQWDREMRERFGLRFRIVDDAALKEIRYGVELGANPFDHVALGLISIDFAKQERVLQDLERSQYDIVVIDEAHHCMRLGKERDDTLRRRLAEVLAQKADALLLLTATPHDGDDLHFASLVELLDPSLIDGRGALRGDAYKRHVVRRLKRHIKDPDTGTNMFRERQVTPVAVELSRESAPTFATLQESLLALVAPQLKRALRRRAYADVLAFVALLKRSVSTARACAATLEVVAARLSELSVKGREAEEARRQRVTTLRELQRRRDRFGALSYEEEQDQALLEAEDIASELADAGAEQLEEKLVTERRALRQRSRELGQVERAQQALSALAKLAAEAEGEDPKVRRVVDLVKTIRSENPRANVLIYTEYTDSQAATAEALESAIAARGVTGSVLQLSGADSEADRVRYTERFTSAEDLILVSTDASAEGLNLHERCHHLIHLELPYNPNRIEQRNGRIDRFGQNRDPRVYYLYLAGTFEERLLLRLVAKYERQRKRLDFVPNTLGVALAAFAENVRLLEGLAEEEGNLFKAQALSFEQAAIEDDSASQAYRDLLGDLDRVFSDFEKGAKAHAWLGDAGLSAGEQSVREASAAQAEGARVGGIDLLAFVVDAVRGDSADAKAAEEVSPGLWHLRLPSSWIYGLDDLPGWEADTRTLRVTTELARTKDDEGRRVGYIGRAHPIVRRALDRVQSLQFGSGAELLDRRVAVARGTSSDPELLLTYVGRVQSAAGRELERVISVRWQRSGAMETLEDVSFWLGLAGYDRGVAARDAWKMRFADWARVDAVQPRDVALRSFEPHVQELKKEHEQNLAQESRDLEVWLRGRTEDLCGTATVQTELFGESEAPAWQRPLPHLERLAAFASHRGQSSRARSEAALVISVFDRRKKALEARGALAAPAVTLLGALLLVPSDWDEDRP